MKLKFTCDGCRSVIRDSDELFNAGRYFAGVIARREYGRRGYVGVCRLESWTVDGTSAEYDAFIGVVDGTEMTGRNIRFSVVTHVVPVPSKFWKK